MGCYEFDGIAPVVDPRSYVHPLASLIGDVIVGPGCWIGPGASLRGDFGRIVLRGDSSVQDSCTIHAGSHQDTVVERGVTIGHGAVVHNCRIGAGTLIGMNAVVLDSAEVGEGCLVAALSLVRAGAVIDDFSVVVGNPGSVKRRLDPEEVTWRQTPATPYGQLASRSLSELVECAPLSEPEPGRRRGGIDAVGVRLSGPVAEERRRRAARYEQGSPGEG